MTERIVYIKKSTNPKKKYMVYMPFLNKTVHFGAQGMSDYTKHKDKERMQRYIARHKNKEDWTCRGMKTAGFWSRWLLWNKTTLKESMNSISRKCRVKFRKWTSKATPRKATSRKRATFRMTRKKRRRTSDSYIRDTIENKKANERLERCVLKVKAKQPKKCFSRKGKWKGGAGCYNPWAVCNKSTRKKSR